MGGGGATRRAAVSGLFGFAVGGASACASGSANGSILTGLDVAAETGFAALAGKRVGLVSNQTGVDRGGRRNLDLMRAAGVDVLAVFAPEHGYWGDQDNAFVQGAREPITGVPIYSLYEGDTHRPHPAWLEGLDVMVFDIADVGARFYTYITTLGYVMEAAARSGAAVHVFDRPNPITGLAVEGPMLDEVNISFVGYARMPVRHGMTAGELAGLFNTHIGVDLAVTRMRGWRRRMWFDETGLSWINPSPNMRNPRAALLYPGLALLEFDLDYSVGRGTPLPFEQIGAAYIDARELAQAMNDASIAGVRIDPIAFTPAGGPLTGRLAHGLRFEVTDRLAFRPTVCGLALAATLQRLYPEAVDFAVNRPLIGSDAVVSALQGGASREEVLGLANAGLDAFADLRRQHLLYA